MEVCNNTTFLITKLTPPSIELPLLWKICLINIPHNHNPIIKAEMAQQLSTATSRRHLRNTWNSSTVSISSIWASISSIFPIHSKPSHSPSATVAPQRNTQTLPSRLRLWSPSLCSQEEQLAKEFLHQKLQGQGSTSSARNYLHNESQFQVSKSSTLLSTIIKQFDKELLQKKKKKKKQIWKGFTDLHKQMRTTVRIQNPKIWEHPKPSDKYMSILSHPLQL